MHLKVKTQPRVVPVQVSVPIMENIQALANEFSPEGKHKIEPDASPVEVLPIFAGRVCYMSFGSKAGRKTASAYFDNTIRGEGTPHLSIIEHSHVALFLDGVSRSFSHEAITHRLQSKSQLSQRFVAPEELCFVVPPALRGDHEAIETLKESWALAAYSYNTLLAREDPSMSFGEKKKVREAARAVLPNATETKMVWSGNLNSWYTLLHKRIGPGVDAEFDEVARIIWAILHNYAPNIFVKQFVVPEVESANG